MDNGDSGPKRFIIFSVALLVLLIQLDVLGYAVYGGENASVGMNYSTVDGEGRSIDIPEEFYYSFRSVCPVLPPLTLSFSCFAPTKILSGSIPDVYCGAPKYNRQTHRMCCVYLI